MTPPVPRPVQGRFVEAPGHLSADSQELWRSTLREFELSGAELARLRLGLEALDRCAEARAELDEYGCFVTDRYGGRKMHPACALERDSRLAGVKILRDLGLETPALPGRRGWRGP